MTDNNDSYIEGELAYDIIKQSLVRIVTADVGTVSEQKDAMQHLIRDAPGNQMVGFEPDTQCVEVAYVVADEDKNRTYTMPRTRIIQDEALNEAAKRVTASAGLDATSICYPSEDE